MVEAWAWADAGRDAMAVDRDLDDSVEVVRADTHVGSFEGMAVVAYGAEGDMTFRVGAVHAVEVLPAGQGGLADDCSLRELHPAVSTQNHPFGFADPEPDQEHVFVDSGYQTN